MSIIISRRGKNAQRIGISAIQEEQFLQSYIHENPDSLPIEEIKAGAKLLIVAREFNTAGGAIDALGLDQDGDIYIIETKLYRNPDKRKVVAQVLDYGASLWRGYDDPGKFLRALDHHVNAEFGMSLALKLGEFFETGDEETSLICDNTGGNLANGRFRFIILMDYLHGQLKDLIIFMNQNTKFDIYAVETEFYKFEDYEILIPRVFGAEVKKDLGGGTVRSKSWNKEEFYDGIEDVVPDQETVGIIKDLDRFAKEKSSLDPWRPGQPPTKTGTFMFTISQAEKNPCLYTVTRHGVIWFYFQGRDEFKKKLQEIGLLIPDSAKEKQISVEVFKNQVRIEDFKRVVMEFQKRIIDAP